MRNHSQKPVYANMIGDIKMKFIYSFCYERLFVYFLQATLSRLHLQIIKIILVCLYLTEMGILLGPLYSNGDT